MKTVGSGKLRARTRSMPLNASFKLVSNAGYSKPSTGKWCPLDTRIRSSLVKFLKGLRPPFLFSCPAGLRPTITFFLFSSRVMFGALRDPT